MKNTILIISCLLLCTAHSFAQTDSIKTEILKYPDTRSEIINKGRKMLLDRFMDDDRKKVADLLSYLVKTEDKDYLTLYTVEKWLLYYWTEQFDSILADAIRYNDSSYNAIFRQQIKPESDMLFSKVRAKMRTIRNATYSDISSSSLSATDKNFLKLNLDYALGGKDYPAITLDTINKEADHFLATSPRSPYEKYVRKYIRYKLVPSKWGLGLEFFSGYGIFSVNLAQRFTNAIPFGMDFDIAYKKFTLYLRDYIGFGNTNDYLPFSTAVWQKGDAFNLYIPEASLGYNVFENRHLVLAPFLGIASTSVSPPSNDQNNKPGYKNIGLDFTRTYVGGINLDLKLAKNRKHRIAFQREDSYTFLRLRYSYNAPQFSSKYDGYDGYFHSITIGIGGLGRRMSRAK